MKWFLIGILICIVMIIAHSICDQYKEKYNFYYNLNYFLKQFKLNLSFRREKLMDFLNNIKAKKQFCIFLDSYKCYLKTNQLDLSKLTLLDCDEKNQLELIVTGIGGLNAQNEINQIEHFQIEIDEKLLKSQNDKNKLCPMILKLSLLFAIGLAIILI